MASVAPAASDGSLNNEAIGKMEAVAAAKTVMGAGTAEYAGAYSGRLSITIPEVDLFIMCDSETSITLQTDGTYDNPVNCLSEIGYEWVATLSGEPINNGSGGRELDGLVVFGQEWGTSNIMETNGLAHEGQLDIQFMGSADLGDGAYYQIEGFFTGND